MNGTQQQAYDRGSTIFSPDGRLYQVEYAREAVGRGSTTVGVRTDGGVALAAGTRQRSPLLEPESVEKLHDLDGRLAAATTGHVADGRRLVDYARRYAQHERLRYGEAPGVDPVAKAVADHVQETTQTGGTRPFGAALLLAGAVEGRPRLFELDPSGTPTEWRATAVGDGSDDALVFLEDAFGGDARAAEDGRDGAGAESTDDADDPIDDAHLPTDDGVGLALRALAEGMEAEPTPATVDVASVDADGVALFDRDRRERVLADAGLGQAS